MRKKFPFFKENSALHYFDSAATTLKPKIVIDGMFEAYKKYTIPIEKAVYKVAENYYESLVIPLKLYLKELFIANEYNIFFGHSVTSLLYQILELCISTILKKNREIKVLLPETVHNSFLIPLQKYNNIQMYFYTNDNYKEFLDIYNFDIVYVATIDHITGKEFNYLDLLEYKKKNNVIVIGDASQSGMYQVENLANLLFDFFLLSSHKMYGPEGLAVLMLSNEIMYKNKNSIEVLNPYFLRGFFAQGSLPYTAYYGFLIALKFLEINIYNNNYYKKKQSQFIDTIYEKIKLNQNLVLIFPTNTKTIISFYHKNKHAHDVALLFSEENICVRSGDLCSNYILKNNNSFVRISFGCYIEQADIDAIEKIILRI